MNSVTTSEARNRFGQLLERVAEGEEIVITRHDQPVARLIPEGRRSLAKAKVAVEGLLAFRRQIAGQNRGKAKLTRAEVKSWIAEGRR